MAIVGFVKGPMMIYKPETDHKDHIFFCTTDNSIYLNNVRYSFGSSGIINNAEIVYEDPTGRKGVWLKIEQDDSVFYTNFDGLLDHYISNSNSLTLIEDDVGNSSLEVSRNYTNSVLSEVRTEIVGQEGDLLENNKLTLISLKTGIQELLVKTNDLIGTESDPYTADTIWGAKNFSKKEVKDSHEWAELN